MVPQEQRELMELTVPKAQPELMGLMDKVSPQVGHLGKCYQSRAAQTTTQLG